MTNSRIWLDNGQTKNLSWIIVGGLEYTSHTINNFKVDDGWFYHQDVKLSKYSGTHKKNAVSTFYGNCIACISENMEGRFKSLLIMPVFLNLVSLLDTLLWPSDGENLVTFRESQIIELTEHFSDNDILLSNLCDIYQVQNECNRLKNLTRYIWENNFKTTYLNMEKNLNQYHHHRRLQKHIACIWNCACDTIYKCKSRMTFFAHKQDKDWLEWECLDNMILREECPFVEDLTLTMQLMLGTAKNCDELQVRHHINILWGASTNARTIDLAGVTLSDLENHTAVMLTRL